MEFISAFDMLKVGIGPSSSHTLGPWKAANQFVDSLDLTSEIPTITVILYGSLALTGIGHATDLALGLGLSGSKPDTVNEDWLSEHIHVLKNQRKVNHIDGSTFDFDLKKNIVFNKTFLKTHPNALTFTAAYKNQQFSRTYYSLGGGFITDDHSSQSTIQKPKVPFPINSGKDILAYTLDKAFWEVVWANELALDSEEIVNSKLQTIWDTMLSSILLGCKSEGILPGGLNVKRRAFDLYENLNGPKIDDNWLSEMRKMVFTHKSFMNWTSCFALAVNEVNASMGRIVTAPTNGSAGVIPAVLSYYLIFENTKAAFFEIKRFLLVAAEIGSVFKKGATISAAMGGCQAEIGVSSAMAAGALAELMGASPAQVLMAAEIAMEHHLGLTCDPVGGLVQIPCIERNAMGAIKAINAAELACKTNPKDALVSLDKVIATMWKTSLDMNKKYKETSKGGLAIEVSMADC